MRISRKIFSLILIAFSQSYALAAEYPHCKKIQELATTQTTTLTGRISDIQSLSACSKQKPILVLTLKKPDEEEQKPMLIYVAPNGFLMRHKMNFALGDDVRVVGIPFAAADETTEFSAVEIEKGALNLSLRDERGRPRWLFAPAHKTLSH